MNNNRFTLSMAGVAALATMAFGQVSRAADKDQCAKEGKTVSAAVSEKPENVLQIVAKEVKESPACACEIVKAAITASKADTDMVVQIVATASEAAPDDAPTIIVCAVKVAPNAAKAIAAHFASGKGVASSGKETTGKGTTKTDGESEGGFEVTDDFGLFHAGVGGIYLTTPSSGLSSGGFLPPVNAN